MSAEVLFASEDAIEIVLDIDSEPLDNSNIGIEKIKVKIDRELAKEWLYLASLIKGAEQKKIYTYEIASSLAHANIINPESNEQMHNISLMAYVGCRGVSIKGVERLTCIEWKTESEIPFWLIEQSFGQVSVTEGNPWKSLESMVYELKAHYLTDQVQDGHLTVDELIEITLSSSEEDVISQFEDIVEKMNLDETVLKFLPGQYVFWNDPDDSGEDLPKIVYRIDDIEMLSYDDAEEWVYSLVSNNESEVEALLSELEIITPKSYFALQN